MPEGLELDFIGIGAEKAGTTWVADMLNEHPEICMSQPKEIHYFNEGSSFAHGYANRNFDKPFAWYARHFAHCPAERVIGEFSTGYLYDATAPRRIHETFPDVRLIACLRNPIRRAVSQYWMFRDYFRYENRDLDTALREEPEYIAKGLYHEQLSRYLRHFPRERMLIVLLDDIKADSRAVLREVYDFLGVDANYVPETAERRSNPAKASRFRFLIPAMKLFSDCCIRIGLSGIPVYLKKLGVKRAVTAVNNRPQEYPPVPPETYAYLREKTVEDIGRLERLLGRDLSHWKEPPPAPGL